MTLGPGHLIRADLSRFGNTYPVDQVTVCPAPDGGPPSIYLSGPEVKGVMIAGDILWIIYPNRRRERLVCITRRDGVTDFVTTRIGWERAA